MRFWGLGCRGFGSLGFRGLLSINPTYFACLGGCARADSGLGWVQQILRRVAKTVAISA